MDYRLIIQSRYGSSRLPGKALYPLAGMPMLVFLIRRLKHFGFADKLVLATTRNIEDDSLAAWGESEKIPVVRGETDDVLARFLRCIEICPADFVLRITADNPLTDPRLVEETVKAMNSGRWDYVQAFEGHPVGSGVDGFSSPMLVEISSQRLEPRHREHINAYLLENEDFYRCLSIRPPKDETRPDVNLTVDTALDWKRVKALIEGQENPIAMSVPNAIERFDSLAL